MKKFLICSTLSLSLLCSSCLGSFSAFNNLKDWNMGVSDSKFVNNLLFWGLNIVPVYGLFFLGDTIIFNVIEFWSGSNPIAMSEGEVETQIIEHEGNQVRLTATKNKMNIEVLDGPKQGKKVDLVYNPSEKSWTAIKENGEEIKLSSFKDGMYIVHLPNKDVQVDPTTSRETGLAMLESHMYANECEALAAVK
ncbi:DUF3332 domain-containing protein [Mesonia aestuariivivens]|uniref:DUF3332 domain-containing protein n=1 Tax=Mesonia aestuariivivens TaxID=2796128 RepID=A0ABS6VXR2_9FLAO|nr:DUF3332 domain-containing protein [Mesonia aestuariivivens]MBW2960372.1 DUF3332 domain-containing protein [Mesonia aestuariivivens]